MTVNFYQLDLDKDVRFLCITEVINRDQIVQIDSIPIEDISGHRLDIVKPVTDENQRLKELQPCGHPVAAITQDGVTQYCRWCAEVEAARAEERERCLNKISSYVVMAGVIPHQPVGLALQAIMEMIEPTTSTR